MKEPEVAIDRIPSHRPEPTRFTAPFNVDRYANPRSGAPSRVSSARAGVYPPHKGSFEMNDDKSDNIDRASGEGIENRNEIKDENVETNYHEMNNYECVIRNGSSEEEETSHQYYCILCEGPHPLSECPDFQALNPDERSYFCRGKGICFKCLGMGHKAANCSSKIRCLVCKGHHHGALHCIAWHNASDGTTEGASFK